MNTKSKKGITGITLAIIMIASIFAVLPFPVAVQAGDGYPPTPTVNDNSNLTQSQINTTPYGTSLRVYGEDDKGPIYGYDRRGQFIYENWTDPFDPAALEKDVLIFNPAVVFCNGYPEGGEVWYGTMSVHSEDKSPASRNINVKKYMRVWYEPDHKYSKNVAWDDGVNYTWPTIEVETTYMLVNAQDFIPDHGDANGTHFVFPIAEKPSQTGLGYFENQDPGLEPFLPNMTDLVGVWANEEIGNYSKTVNGTIVLEKGYALDLGEEVQFLDHKLRYDYVVRKDGDYWAKVTVKYAGNINDDTARGVILGEFDGSGTPDPNANTYFDRHNNRYDSASSAEHRTWYARYDTHFPGNWKAHIYVGKQISAGDTFYVNAVRYDVPAIEVLDTDGKGTNGAECFKYITLRTPLPKYEASVLVPDDGKVSSQWIDTIAPLEVIPLNPPFNTNHKVVDDINIVLWNSSAANWPCGTYTNPDSVGVTYWPWAERYLTMQYEEIVKEVHDVAGVDGENNVTVGLNWYNHFSPTEINRDAKDRIIPDLVSELKFVYHEELEEPRFTTTMLEKLHEELLENPVKPPEESWTWFDIQTRPSEYTAFALPQQPDDLTPEGALNKTGDYILASAFLAPNSVNRSDLSGYLVNKTPQGVPKMAFAFDPLYELDVCTGALLGGGLDLYVNSHSDTAASIRIYGEEDIGPINGYLDRGMYQYPADDYQAPFKPQAIRKDSITFNPAIIQWDGVDYKMHAYNKFRPVHSNNIDVKKYLRMWYEPEHRYSKNVEWEGDEVNYTYPTIEIESTYMLIDSQYKKPIAGAENYTVFAFPIAANWTTTEIKGLEEFENPESSDAVPADKNMVRLALVNNTGTLGDYNKTTRGLIRIEKTYEMAEGASIQFLDHEIRYDGVLAGDNISVAVRYAGSTSSEGWTAGYELTRENLWFDREGGTFSTPNHPAVKWYARHNGYFLPYNNSFIVVGMELQAGDVFYVDGVRYDVPAIEVIDGDDNGTNGAELFKYITLRTPLPKKDGITVEEDTVPDSGIMSSQNLFTYEPGEILPVDPPFNKPHMIVDDIDVCPVTYPDVEDRIIGPYDALNITYIAETLEPRYSSNLMEILWENVTGTDPIVEGFTKFEVISRPDQYTEFVLPGDNARYDWVNGTWGEDLHNDYLVTTSFLANNSIGLADLDAEDLTDYTYDIPRAAFVYDVINLNGVYINEIVGAPPLPGAVLNVSCNVTPPETLSGFPVTACVRVPTAQANFPLTITVDWDDGSADSVGVLPNNSAEICFEHIYFAQGIKNITQTARDIYGNTGVNDSTQVNVTSDGFKLVVGPGWNFFSIPVNDTTNGIKVSDIFGPTPPSWLTTVYRWNEDNQNWDTLGWGDYVYPKYGYFVWGPSSGTEEFIVTGTNEAFDDSWWSGYTGEWIAVGPGYQPQTITQWAYGWNSVTWSYSPTYNLGVGNGYFVTV